MTTKIIVTTERDYQNPKPPIYFMSIGHWAWGDRSSPLLAPLLKTQIFYTNEIASSNCLPAAPPKQKKVFGHWAWEESDAFGGKLRTYYRRHNRL